LYFCTSKARKLVVPARYTRLFSPLRAALGALISDPLAAYI